MGLPLRPLEIKQLFDFSIRIYRGNFAPMMLLNALLQAPLAVAMTLFLYHLTNIMEKFQQATAPGGPASSPGAPFPTDIFTEHADVWFIVGGVFVLAAIFQLLLLPLIHVAVSRLAAATITGEACTTREALAYAGERYWATQAALATYLLPLLGLALLTLLPVAALAGGDPATLGVAAIGSLGFIWIGVLATWLMYFRYFPAISGAVQANEDPPWDVRGAGARGLWYLKRSFGLTTRYYWRCLGMLLLLWFALGFVQRGVNESVRLLVWLVWLPTHMPQQGGEEQLMAVMQSMNAPVVVAWALAFTSLFALLTPGLILCYQTLLYFDLRFRKEGLDLQLLLNDLPKLEIAPAVQGFPAADIGI